jgi:hypothetical protein
VFTGQSHPQKTRPNSKASISGRAAPRRRAAQAPGARSAVSRATTGSRKVRPKIEKYPNPPTMAVDFATGSGKAPTVAEKRLKSPRSKSVPMSAILWWPFLPYCW